MAALVDGRPIPFSFIASRKASSSTVLPADSMARSRVPSVYALGACVVRFCSAGS